MRRDRRTTAGSDERKAARVIAVRMVDGRRPGQIDRAGSRSKAGRPCRERREQDDMAENGLRRLRRRELLQMLIVQCEETERLQQELEETSARLTVLEESYERLKIKLNVKDERLNQKDAAIAELNETIEEMQTSKMIELNEAGSIAEAALRLNGIFEVAQRSAEQYLLNVKRICGEATAAAMAGEQKTPGGGGKQAFPGSGRQIAQDNRRPDILDVMQGNRRSDIPDVTQGNRKSDILDVSQAYARRKGMTPLSQEKGCIVQGASPGEEAKDDSDIIPLASSGGIHG